MEAKPGRGTVTVWRVALIARPRVNDETGHMPEEKPELVRVAPAATAELVADPPAVRPSVDDMGEASFPASDPPAVWTWDPPPPRR